MTDNEKLIEDAAKAIRNAGGGAPFAWESLPEGHREYRRTQARAALAVFEQAEGRVGPCWDRGPQMLVPKGQCAPERPLCELPAGHAGAHVGGSATWRHWPPERITPTDDERAIFEALADRLGEHQQARNYEIADSGEYETMLRGPIDVEVLAEWLTPTVLGFRRTVQGEPSDAHANAAARAIIEHDEDRLTCYDHPEDFCCPCGELRGATRSEWQRHQARAALRAAGGVR